MDRTRNVRREPFVTAVRPQRAIVASLVMTAVAVTMAASGTGPTGGNRRVELRSISSKFDAKLTTVMIESSEPVAYVTAQPDPLTVLIDLRNVSAGFMAQPIGPLPPITGVDVQEMVAADGESIARVRVRLDRPAVHRVHSSRDVIYVDVERPLRAANATSQSAQESTQARASVPPARSTPSATSAARPATTLRAVRSLPNGAGVVLVGNGELVASKVEEAKDLPPRLLLDFANVRAQAVPAATEVNQGEIKRVRVGLNSQTPLITRVVIDLVKRMAYHVERAGDELRVLFDAATGVTETSVVPTVLDPPPAQDAAQAAPPDPIVADVPAPAGDAPLAPSVPSAPSTVSATQATADVLQQPVPPPTVQNVPPPPPSRQQRFSGNPISLDFQGADLRAVLRTFADISGMNIVIDPTINGTVDVSLRDVPWDQALDIILKANQLGYSVDGTVVRIQPLKLLAQEQEERRKLAEAQALAGDLSVLTIPLSYAKAPELVPILTRSALSARGEVQVDTRTNTLIVRDLPDRLTTAADLVKALDRPQPQVEIEARIVQTTRDFARSIGVQWGFNGRVDPALGTSTSLAFPNNGTLGGRTGGVQGSLQGGTVERAVNLGVPAATSAIGLALGSVNGALNLDVVLSQLERTGRGRLLSTPRVSTQNNVEAEMTQGLQIPIQTVANNTVTVTFKDAALILRVTPQITAANTVIMRVFLENATPDFSRAINGIPPIDTQRAVTSVLVADGETTVIGGIYVSREQATEGRVPMLHRVPLLGWLFKRDETSDESRELLIFITPRITRS